MNNKTKFSALLLITISLSAIAQDTTVLKKPAGDAEELAKKLANPVASLISVPFQNNTDVGIGENDSI